MVEILVMALEGSPLGSPVQQRSTTSVDDDSGNQSHCCAGVRQSVGSPAGGRWLVGKVGGLLGFLRVGCWRWRRRGDEQRRIGHDDAGGHIARPCRR